MALEFSFNLKKAAIFQAVKWEKIPCFHFVGILKKLFLVLFLCLFIIFLYAFLGETLTPPALSKLLGSSIISLVLFVICCYNEAFLNSKLKKPRLCPGFDEQAKLINEAIKNAQKYNLAEFLSFEVARAVYKSINFAQSKKLPEINSSILFYFLLKDNPKLNFIFSRALLNIKEIKKILESHFKINETRQRSKVKAETIGYSKDFQDVILEALKIAQKRKKSRIGLGDTLISLSLHDLVFKKILIDAKLKTQDMENLVRWLEYLEEKTEERKRWWEYKNLIKRGTLAKEWAAGFTVTLDKFSIDWSEIMKKRGFPEVIGHQKEMKQMERILAQKKNNNVLLVGEPGTGRKSIVEALITKSFLGQSLPEINYKRVKELDLPSLLAQLETKEEVEVVLDKIFREVVSVPNTILLIDEFHNFVGTKERPGAIDISGILSSYLKLPQFQLIAITNFSGLHKNIEQNPSVLSLFGKVEVSEISERETLMLLENLALSLETRYKKFVSYPALSDIITYTERYFPSLPFPEKAIDLLNEVMVYLSTTKEKILLPSHVAKIVSEKAQIPVGEIEVREREVLLNLEKLIHERIINQDEAVNGVAAALRRARAEVTIKKGPIGGFLFLGPTGVGKTETAKALTEIYFGSGQRDKSLFPPRPDVAGLGEERMIRLDMSEFQAVNDIPRLIGSKDQEGLLTTQVRENPFSLILLDEIEKAHPNILNLFLQVLDEGHLTDGVGRKVDFRNSIIIATSNAGYKVILKALKEKTEWSQVKEKLLDYLFEKAIFRPEFINRFDAVIIFRPLSKENLLDIAELMLQKLKKNLKEKDIEFIITGPLKEKVVELGYNPVFGAREMRRVIQDKIENVLAEAILSDKLKRGDRLEIDPENFELIIK